MDNVEVRDSCPDDTAYVFATWLRSYKDLNAHNKWIRNSDFFPLFHARVEKILKRKSTFVWIAHPKDEAEVILGYMALEYEGGIAPVIHYVFVDPKARRMGIAKKLMDHAGVDLTKRATFTHWTFTENPATRERFDLIKQLLYKHRELSFNPYYGQD